MATIAIPRMNLAAYANDMSVERAKLAREVSEKLDYKVFAAALQQAPGMLLDTLVKLGITPLDPKAVEAHKASKESVSWWRRAYGYALPFWVAMLATIVNAVRVLSLPASRHPDIAENVGLAVIVNVVLGLVTFGGILDPANKSMVRKCKTWRTMLLSKYPQGVPEPLLLAALQIAGAQPKARFYVDELVTTGYALDIERRSQAIEARRLADPFLYVEYENETYYLGAWDEHEFEGSL